MGLPRYRQHASWQQAMNLVVHIYRVSRGFPADERSGLTATLRRTATTISGKIADGLGRLDSAEAHRAFTAAQAALRELATHLIVARRLRFISSLRLAMCHRRCQKLYTLLDEAEKGAGRSAEGHDREPSLREAA